MRLALPDLINVLRLLAELARRLCRAIGVPLVSVLSSWFGLGSGVFIPCELSSSAKNLGCWQDRIDIPQRLLVRRVTSPVDRDSFEIGGELPDDIQHCAHVAMWRGSAVFAMQFRGATPV